VVIVGDESNGTTTIPGGARRAAPTSSSPRLGTMDLSLVDHYETFDL
jgi:hypothetical protein